MLLYYVSWFLSRDLCKGKGRAKNSEEYIQLCVLCRSSRNALSCLHYYYDNVFPHRSKFDFGDGEVTLKRMIIDSRGFHPHYLMTDELRQPIDLVDIRSNFSRWHNML